MIKTPTVLILGAGASQPYGFPTGRELFNLITSKLLNKNEDPALNVLLREHFDAYTADTLGETLHNSDAPSIDAFLEKHPTCIKAGKFLISYFMLLYESRSNLLNYESTSYWYNFLKDKMLEDCPLEKFGENNISIITFNYDRSLEQYLTTVLPESYEISDDKHFEICNQQLRDIDFVHVYGSPGPLIWQAEEYSAHLDYQNEYNWDMKIINNCTQNIKTISEAKENDEIKKARDWLKNAQRVYFLGFGYHPENLNILELGNIRNETDVRGTCLGLDLTRKNHFLHLLEKTIYTEALSTAPLYTELLGSEPTPGLKKLEVESRLVDTDVCNFLRNCVILD